MNATLIKWVATSTIAALMTKAAQPAIKKTLGLDPNTKLRHQLADAVLGVPQYLDEEDDNYEDFLEEEE